MENRGALSVGTCVQSNLLTLVVKVLELSLYIKKALRLPHFVFQRTFEKEDNSCNCQLSLLGLGGEKAENLQ